LRPRGAKIKDNGESSGPVHFMQLFDKVSSVVSQGSSRRGAFAAYLPVEHPDIMEFLQIRDTGNPIQEMNFGVTITDKWMQDMVDGDKNNRKIWSKIIQKRFESGYPYIFFTDTVNNGSPQVYKDKELTINASNLCVVGDTMIEILINDIEKLKIKIEDLNFYLQKYKNTKVKSFDTTTNLTCFSEITDFAQTGESSDIIEIEDENGNIIKCTPEHKIYTKNRGYVEAQFLKSDDVLENLK
jgi:ribonucleoside-diphosphate reductase alpha chain